MNSAAFRSYISSTFVMDLRSLALFRIGLGMTILVDLANRFTDLRMFYTDEGFLMAERILKRNWSIHAWFGSLEWAYFLFFLSAVFAVLLVFGYRSRIFIGLLFLMTISLHMRCPVINNAGDQLLRLILFIGFFLPMNSIWSIRAEPKSDKDQKFSPWIMIYYIQIITMYFIAGFSKFNMTWNWGMGIHYAMHQYTFAKPAAVLLLDSPSLSFFLTQAVLMLERFGWVLLVVPSKNQVWRLVCVLGFVMLHFGFYFFMELGMFPLIVIVAWLPLIPSIFWDKLNVRQSGIISVNSFNYINWIIPIVFVLIASYGVYRKNPKLPKWRPAEVVLQNILLYQGWTMFSGPNKYDSWIVIKAKLENGAHVDLYRDGRPVNYTKPNLYSAEFKSHRQRKFFKSLTRKELYFYRQYYLHWLIKEWNTNHKNGENVVYAWFYNMHEDILPQGGYAPVEKKLLTEMDGDVE